MKRTWMLVLVAAFSLSSKAQDHSQNLNGVNIEVGKSLIGLTLDRVLKSDDLKYSFNDQPTITVGYDRQLTSWFSIGGSYSRQSMDVLFEEYIDSNGLINTGDFTANVNRNIVHLRANAFYDLEKVRFISGFRFGITHWGSDVEAEKRYLNFLDKITNVTLPSAGWMVLGIQYFPQENIGIGLNVNVGSPHLAAVSTHIKF